MNKIDSIAAALLDYFDGDREKAERAVIQYSYALGDSWAIEAIGELNGQDS